MADKEISEAAAAMGRKGGRAKVPKGLATMSAEDRKRVQSAGGKARWKAAKKATKKATKKKAAK